MAGEQHAAVALPAALNYPSALPHTVYMRSLHCIAGRSYCGHHVIRAAVAGGVITEVKADAGPVATVPRGASSEGRFRPVPG